MATNPLPDPRPLTTGPNYHWFGYYDKRQFDPTGRYVLGMEVDFEPDGTLVVIDSAHGGNGRQMYLLDIADIVREPM